MSDTENLRLLRDVISWNKKEFYRAIGEDRLDDATRLKGNIEKLEGLISDREFAKRKDTDPRKSSTGRESSYGGL